ncbi:PAS domain S-box protein [Haloplanus sp. C73]|uniref:PAS domain S-box protein n=1 Tax=Haloplanus sp. C73 TaxID=3421641 RepID=UPI003EBDE673
MADYQESSEKNPDTRPSHAPDRFCEQFGYTRAELLELSFEEFVAEESHALRGETGAGEAAPVETYLEALRTAARQLVEADTVEEVAELTVDTLHGLVGSSHAGIYTSDEDELVPVVSSDQTAASLGDSLTVERGEEMARTAYETGEPQYDASVGERDDPTDGRCLLALPLDEHGALLVGSAETNAFGDRDIEIARTLTLHATTALDRISADQTLREEWVFVDQTLDTIADLFYVLDLNGTLQRWNDRLPEVTGYADADIEGMNAVEFFPEDEHGRISDAIETVLTTGQTTVEADLLTADGERIPYEFIANRLTDRDGTPSGLVGVGRDITERKEREQQLARQNERLEEFTSVVSHDLRNPLNVAQGRLKLARKECDSDHLTTLASAHDRMETLIEDLLALARGGATTMDPEDVALANVVTRCWQNVETAGATLHVDATHTIRADHARLQQLLENLIRNAVEHGSTGNQTPSDDAVDHGGTDVLVRVGDLPSGFFIEDDGPGIPEETRAQIFEAGYTTADDGTGYGLQIANEVAVAHGWDIIASEADNGGARFEITDVTLCD